MIWTLASSGVTPAEGASACGATLVIFGALGIGFLFLLWIGIKFLGGSLKWAGKKLRDKD